MLIVQGFLFLAVMLATVYAVWRMCKALTKK